MEPISASEAVRLKRYETMAAMSKIIIIIIIIVFYVTSEFRIRF